MKDFLYRESVGVSTFDEISKFEIELGLSLPKSYKKFLAEVGGGYAPNYDLILPNDETFHYPIQYFLAPKEFLSEDNQCINIRDMRRLWHIPSCFLIFAEDPSGQYFVFDLRPEPEFFGKIYVRDHDHALNPKPFLSAEFFEGFDCDPDEAPLYHPIADSFEAFIGMLKKEDAIDAG
jgi:hypothetical protein